MSKVKLSIIGATGTTYKRTIPALVNSDVCDVVAIQGRNLDKLKKIQREYKIRDIYTDISEMLTTTECDCIYIGTPPFLHEEEVALAASTLKPIICEKPFSMDYETGVRISKLLSAYNDRTFMIAHHLRHQKAITDIKVFIENGEIGKLLNASMQWGFEMNLNAPNAIWKLNPELGGKGTFSDNGIHIVDLAIHLFGTPNKISGNILKVRSKETFDNETGFLVYDNNLCVQLQSSQSMKYSGNHILIYGDKGSIEAFYAIGEKSIRQIIVKSAEKQETLDYSPTNLYCNEVENFCRRLIDPSFQNVGTTLNEGLTALKIIDVIRDAANTSSTINFTL